MKKRDKSVPDPDIRAEYDFASMKGGVRGKYAERYREGQSNASAPRCGLCGKTSRLQKTDCCGNWICDDEGDYVLFSYARNSCSRNHARFTLCGSHRAERHKGAWAECAVCRASFQTEMYVYYGTNEYNFVKLQNPPAFEPTLCTRCRVRINLGEDGYSRLGDEFWCEACGEIPMEHRRVSPGELPPSPRSPRPRRSPRLRARARRRG